MTRMTKDKIAKITFEYIHAEELYDEKVVMDELEAVFRFQGAKTIAEKYGVNQETIQRYTTGKFQLEDLDMVNARKLVINNEYAVDSLDYMFENAKQLLESGKITVNLSRKLASFSADKGIRPRTKLSSIIELNRLGVAIDKTNS